VSEANEQSFELTKLQAAQRQLNGAIRLLFDDEDPVLVHTIAGAASILFSDLIENAAPHKSWDKQAQDANGLDAAEYFRIMREYQNFLKHAKDDPDAKLVFEPVETEAIIFWAVMNASEIAPMSNEAQVFQLWYVASHSPQEIVDIDTKFQQILAEFGDLRNLTRANRLKYGAQALASLPDLLAELEQR
jgi:hypothetical protein